MKRAERVGENSTWQMIRDFASIIGVPLIAWTLHTLIALKNSVVGLEVKVEAVQWRLNTVVGEPEYKEATLSMKNKLDEHTRRIELLEQRGDI